MAFRTPNRLSSFITVYYCFALAARLHRACTIAKVAHLRHQTPVLRSLRCSVHRSGRPAALRRLHPHPNAAARDGALRVCSLVQRCAHRSVLSVDVSPVDKQPRTFLLTGSLILFFCLIFTLVPWETCLFHHLHSCFFTPLFHRLLVSVHESLRCHSDNSTNMARSKNGKQNWPSLLLCECHRQHQKCCPN